MKRITVLLIFLVLSSTLFAFSEEQLELTHNPEFALYQRLQLDTVIARKSSNNRIVISELELRDLVPSMSATNQNYYITFNDNLGALKLLDIQRERLELLHEEKQKSSLTALVPNALSIATVAFTTGLTNPLGAIISIAGTAVSSATSYLDAKNQENLAYMQSQWELDDQEMQILLDLGKDTYTYKSQIATDLNIPVELTLSTEDMESFADFRNESNQVTKKIKLQTLDKRLEILPDYWMELALTTYELKDYETTLNYIEKFEEIYYPVIYHDSDYAHLLMIKIDCLNHLSEGRNYQELEEIGDLLLSHIKAEDWQKKFFVLSLYMEIYRNTENIEILQKAYDLFPSVLINIGDRYSSDLQAYLNREYVRKGLAEIDTDIESAKSSVEAAEANMANAKKAKYDKNGAAYTNIEQKLADAERKLEDLKSYKKEFKKTGDLMLPPSSEFFCSMMNQYMSIAKELNETSSSKYKDVCSYFLGVVSQDVNNYERYSPLFSSINSNKPSNTVIYKNDKEGGFWGMGQTNLIHFEIPLSCFDITSNGSEQLFDQSEIELILQLNGQDNFNLKINEVSIETGDTLEESFFTIVASYNDTFNLSMKKPEKDSDFVHLMRFEITSNNGYFNSFGFSINNNSEMYKEVAKRIKYSKEGKTNGKKSK